MRIIVTSDWHPDKSTAGFPRFDDVETAVKQSVDDACRGKDGRADLYVFNGDLCNPESPELIRCQVLATRAARTLAEHAIPSIWLVGNHDVLEDGRNTTVLDPLAFVGRRSFVQVVKQPELVGAGNDKFVACFPYAPTSHSYDPLEHVRAWAARPEAKDVVLVASHLMLEGIGPGSEEDMPRGRDVLLPVDEVMAAFPNAVVTQGHYHTGQVFRRVHVVGSLCCFTRADVGVRPRYLDLRI